MAKSQDKYRFAIARRDDHSQLLLLPVALRRGPVGHGYLSDLNSLKEYWDRRADEAFKAEDYEIIDTKDELPMEYRKWKNEAKGLRDIGPGVYYGH